MRGKWHVELLFPLIPLCHINVSSIHVTDLTYSLESLRFIICRSRITTAATSWIMMVDPRLWSWWQLAWIVAIVDHGGWSRTMITTLLDIQYAYSHILPLLKRMVPGQRAKYPSIPKWLGEKSWLQKHHRLQNTADNGSGSGGKFPTVLLRWPHGFHSAAIQASSQSHLPLASAYPQAQPLSLITRPKLLMTTKVMSLTFAGGR